MELLFEILGIVVTALKGFLPGNTPVNLAGVAIQIAQAANAMHVQEAGKPIDLSLLTPETPIT